MEIHLNKFQPRDYQLGLFDAIENKGYKRALIIHPRRAGKDIMTFNLAIRYALMKPRVIWYILPEYAQGRKIIFDNLTIDGQRVLDFIPAEAIASMNKQAMTIRFVNNSIFQVVGSDRYDSLMGANPSLCVFSEYAMQDPTAFQYILPMIRANKGTAIFLSTPRGKNHFYDLYNIALSSPDWYVEKLSLDDTKHISPEEIQQDIDLRIMTEDMAQQEYWCSFDMGIEGTFYGKYLDKMRLKGQITTVPHETGFKVHVALDIGMRDATTLIFYQVIGPTVRIIDCYDKSGEGLEHYVAVIKSKPYIYGSFIAPHDIKVREWGSGMSRLEQARNLGINFTLAPDVGVLDGIESVRSALSKIWIDETKCAKFIKSLENYRKEWDDKKKDYKPVPLHDQYCHYADAMRYLCISLPKVSDARSPEELDRQYKEAMYGEQNNVPRMFR